MLMRERPTRTIADLRSVAVCPVCSSRLDWGGSQPTCARCPRVFRIADSIPILLADPDLTEDKRRQAEWFDEQENTDFEITRPHGTPELYRWYYDDKFRRSVSRLRSELQGATVLTICGGSGMDAEFLAGVGCRVISSDISLGACRRAAERARRYDLAITPVVADAERLPFADRSVEVVYVHDGLHHLDRPEVALEEMMRVANRAISLTEPAEAFVTAVAVKVKLALAEEEAGNEVKRLRLEDLGQALRSRGFSVLDAHRYAMYYKHEPRRVIEFLSRPGLRHLTQAAVSGFNAVAGRLGNRLTIQAIRTG